ncbi:T9SS type A sorting domain-containing protein [Fluviicola chungangensis]|uniref:T9SS type A sorting domain-containing protein n=1 Tax=Fluviicola chungangensis TaxID=2597671 RepID=A0A556MR17_9FLAO|nr:T9SS type A sorting domain-containing protein [Fluviicola chungangensis]TSJ42325.1 T9SS type A sorting domain-containing protein [Fluviicola chungangensis]
MKLNLLLATSLITGAAFGQFTQSNEPVMGSTMTMFLLDSNAVDYAAVTGTGVTWDYSTTPGITGETKDVTVALPSATTNGSDYTSSTWAIDIAGFMTSYYTSSASSRISQGYAFDGGNGAGTVRVVFDGGADDALIMNYPYDVTNSLTDAFAGNAITDNFGTLATSGGITTIVDGQGTLKLNAATTLSNVTRFKLSDQATAVIPIPGLGNVIMERTQYEYYTMTNPYLPVLVHSTLVITLAGTPTTQHIVMSSVAPDEYLAVSENNKATFGLYPNPANESVVISGLAGNETIAIVDMAGRTVLTTQNNGTSQTLNVADFQAGIYNVVVTANGIKSTKKLTIN